MKKHKAFTLIEIMIVLATIGMLIAFLIPKSSIFKNSAKDVVVMKNIDIVKAKLELWSTQNKSITPELLDSLNLKNPYNNEAISLVTKPGNTQENYTPNITDDNSKGKVILEKYDNGYITYGITGSKTITGLAVYLYSESGTDNSAVGDIPPKVSISGLPIPTESDLDKSSINDVDSPHNKVWHWAGMASWMQDAYIAASNASSVRGCFSAKFTFGYNSSTSYIHVGWRPILEIQASDILISGKKTGDIINLGTLYVNNVKIKLPINPIMSEGDIYSYTSGNIEIRDTDTDDAYKIKWVYVKDGDKTLLIADRNLITNITWNTLNSQNLVFGKDLTIGGQTYKCRLLTGGNAYKDSQYNGALDVNNEWDRYISMEYWK